MKTKGFKTAVFNEQAKQKQLAELERDLRLARQWVRRAARRHNRTGQAGTGLQVHSTVGSPTPKLTLVIPHSVFQAENLQLEKQALRKEVDAYEKQRQVRGGLASYQSDTC